MKENAYRQKMLNLRRNPSGYTTHTFLWVPLVYALANVVLAILLSPIDPSANDELRNQGLQMSNRIMSTSITILALTFSLTFLSIQIAAQSYSPRLLDDFIKDPVSKIAIAVNVGAFAYSYTMLFYLRSPQRVPSVAIHFLSVQAIAVVVMFVVFIHYFVNGFRLENILLKAVTSSWNAARTLEQRSLESSKSATTKEEDVMLVQLDVCIRYHPQIGEFVAEGTVIAYAWDGDISCSFAVAQRQSMQARVLGSYSTDSNFQVQEVVEETLGKLVADGIKISPLRSGQLDITLGIQQLVDVAVRAKSNDPHTVVQAINSLSTLFGHLAYLDFIPLVLARDKTGTVRISSPQRSFTYLLSILDSIRYYGCGDLKVMYRLIRFYGDLGASLKRLKKLDRIPAVMAQLEQCLVFAKRNFEAVELKSICELYECELQVMVVSNYHVLKEEESVEDDLQDLETTYATPTSDFIVTVPDNLKEEVLPR
jgi:uncharacterized membrane protein